MTADEAKNLPKELIRAALPPKINELKLLFVHAQDYISASMLRDIEEKYLEKETSELSKDIEAHKNKK